jgi:hypothetical protein
MAYMKISPRIFTATILFFVCLQLMSCSSSSANGNSPNGSASPASTNIQAKWVITATEVGGSTSTFNVSLVSSTCTVFTPIGTFNVQGPSCFIADDNTGQGSISGTGNFFYAPQGVLIGVSANPAPSGASVDLLFAEADQFGDAAVFGGNGTITNGTLTGNWSCNPNSPVCNGLSGTFSGTIQ